jgi:hypothetical protein
MGLLLAQAPCITFVLGRGYPLSGHARAPREDVRDGDPRQHGPTTAGAEGVQWRASVTAHHSPRSHARPPSLRAPSQPFIHKLYTMVSSEATAHILGWSEDGAALELNQLEMFVSELLPLYFKHTNLSSFVRQLNTSALAPVSAERPRRGAASTVHAAARCKLLALRAVSTC